MDNRQISNSQFSNRLVIALLLAGSLAGCGTGNVSNSTANNAAVVDASADSEANWIDNSSNWVENSTEASNTAASDPGPPDPDNSQNRF